MPTQLLKLSELTCFVATIALATGPAIGQSQKRKAPRAQITQACAGLQRDLNNLSKSMAMNFAEGIGDNSAQRETMRETQYQSLLSRVRMTMDLMRDSRCKFPTSVPTGKEYASAAIACRGEILSTGRSATEGPCDQSKWPKEAK